MSGGTWEYKNKVLDEIADYYEEKEEELYSWLSKLSRTMDEIYQILDEIEAGDRCLESSKQDLQRLFITAEILLRSIRRKYFED